MVGLGLSAQVLSSHSPMDLGSPPQETGIQCIWFLGLLFKSDFCTVNVIKKQGKEGGNNFFKIS